MDCDIIKEQNQPAEVFMGKNQEERKTPVIVVKKRRTFSPPSLSEKTDIIAPVFTEQTAESAPAGIN